MNAAETFQDKPRPTRWVAMLIYAALGAVCGGLFARFMKTHAEALAWADVVALIVALVALGSGLIVLGASTSRKTCARMMKLDDLPGPLEMLTFRLQGLVLVLAGLLMAAPVVPDFAPVSPEALYLGVLVVFALQTVGNLFIWFKGDELIRRVVVETGAASFWVLQGGLFLYAAAERLGLVEALTAWQATAVMMCVYVLTSVVVTVRRGLS